MFTKSGDKVPLIATAKVKWDHDYQEKLGVETHAAKDLPDGVETAIIKQCIRTYRALFLTGYARIDLRLADDGRAYVLEANPNPEPVVRRRFRRVGRSGRPQVRRRCCTASSRWAAATRPPGAIDARRLRPAHRAIAVGLARAFSFSSWVPLLACPAVH